MQTMLALVTLAASAIGLVYSVLTLPPEGRRELWRRLLARELRPWLGPVLLLGVLGALATLPSLRPFTPGMPLGWGLLLGLLLGFWCLARTLAEPAPAGTGLLVGLLAGVAAGGSLVLLLFRGNPTDALVGWALGSLFVAGGTLAWRLRPEITAPYTHGARGAELGALLTIAVAAGTRLGIAHFPRPMPEAAAGGYWVVPSLLLAAAALALIIGDGLWPAAWRARRDTLDGVGAAAVMVLGVGALQARLLPDLMWTVPLWGGLIGGLIVLTLQREARQTPPDSWRPQALVLCGLLGVLAITVLTFRTLQGYGEALAALPLLVLVASLRLRAPHPDDDTPGILGMGIASTLLLFILLHLFRETAGLGVRLDAQIHYDLLALILGLLPWLSLQTLLPGPVASWGSAMSRLALLGIGVAALPLTLGVLWGARAEGHSLLGMLVSGVAWSGEVARYPGPARARLLQAAPFLLLLGAGLVAIQFTPLLQALTLTRIHRVALVGLFTVGAVLWTFIAGYRRPAMPGEEEE
jgi:hypothetical protein